MWKIGPECAAQQAKNVSASTRNCGERSALPTDHPAPGTFIAGEPDGAGSGARRTSSAAGSNSAHAIRPTVIIAVRQSYVEISQRAKGEMVIGEKPIPARSNETASLR